MATARRHAIVGTIGAVLLGAPIAAWLALRPDAAAGPCVVVNGPATIRDVNEAMDEVLNGTVPARLVFTYATSMAATGATAESARSSSAG